jgi:hypothetical protein
MYYFRFLAYVVILVMWFWWALWTCVCMWVCVRGCRFVCGWTEASPVFVSLCVGVKKHLFVCMSLWGSACCAFFAFWPML